MRTAPHCARRRCSGRMLIPLLAAAVVLGAAPATFAHGPTGPSKKKAEAPTSLHTWAVAAVNRTNEQGLLDVREGRFGTLVHVPCVECGGTLPKVVKEVPDEAGLARMSAQSQVTVGPICIGIGGSIVGGAIVYTITECFTGFTQEAGCSSNQACTSWAGCSTGGDCTVATGCSSGTNCTVAQECSTGRDCTYGSGCSTGTNCTKGPDCTEVEDCTEGTGCSSGQQCTGGPNCSDHSDCTTEGACTSGPNCSSGQECTSHSGCSSQAGSCTQGTGCSSQPNCSNGGYCPQQNGGVHGFMAALRPFRGSDGVALGCMSVLALGLGFAGASRRKEEDVRP